MKIACIGTQNTGKTTFVNDFQNKHPSFKTTRSSYRDVVKRHNLPINLHTTISSQWIIFASLLDSIALNSSENLIFDRTAFDAYIYTKKAFPNMDGLEEMKELAIANLKLCNYIFFFTIEGNEHIRIADDGLRSIDPQFRIDVDNLFVQEINGMDKTKMPPIFYIRGTREQRINAIANLQV